MALLDEILPEVSTAALAQLLSKPAEDRPSEGTYFEFTEKLTEVKVAKSVAAFANTEGGFLMIGAEAKDGRLKGFPGEAEDVEWPLQIANRIIGQVSPLPAWEPFVVASPTRGPRVVVVVKVPPSRRTPHVVTNSARIYQRSPGGSSDPIRDRATLDLLVRRGQDGERAVCERADHHLDPFVLADPVSRYLRQHQWWLAIVAVPVPFGSAPQIGLLTRRGYLESPALFVRGNILQAGQPAGMVEDGLRLDFGRKEVLVLRDGTMRFVWKGDSRVLAVPTMADALAEVLVAQRRLHPPVRESRVFVLLQTGGGVFLSERSDAEAPGRAATARTSWRWEADTVTEGEQLRDTLAEFSRTAWRAVGKEEFDPD